MQNKVSDHKKANKDKREISRLEELARKPNLFLIVNMEKKINLFIGSTATTTTMASVTSHI